jgi:hypothetical protein
MILKIPKTHKMNKNEKYIRYEAQELVDKFNKLYLVGSTVMHRTTAVKSIPFKEQTVRAKAFVSNSLQPVAFFVGISGYCSIEPDFVKYPEA